MVQHFIMSFLVIQILSLVHFHTPHLRTTSLIRQFVFTFGAQVQIPNLNIATSSGTHRIILMIMEHLAQMET
jgi:hypothetical protein